MTLEIDRIYCGDCLDFMREMPDKSVDLVLTDPPYGIGMDGGCIGHKGANVFDKLDWDVSPPDARYFHEIFRISRNQVIFGGNYFNLPPTRGFIVWDKGGGFKGRTYAECEYVWTSFDQNARIYKRDPLAQGDYHGRLHPTQKPVPLFVWILERYSKPGDLVLDPFLGSGTTAIACLRTGRHFIGIEKHEPYFIKAQERIDKERQQVRLIPYFDFEEATS